MAGVSFEDLEVGKIYLITLLEGYGPIKVTFSGQLLKNIPGVIVKKEVSSYSGEKIVSFLSEEINKLEEIELDTIRNLPFSHAKFIEQPRLSIATNVKSLARQTGLPAAVGLNIASFLNPSLSKTSPENLAAETKFGHKNVPPGHYTMTDADKAFEAGKRRKTRKSRKSRKSRKTRKTRKLRTRHH